MNLTIGVRFLLYESESIKQSLFKMGEIRLFLHKINYSKRICYEEV